jgi:hypothetical protein
VTNEILCIERDVFEKLATFANACVDIREYCDYLLETHPGYHPDHTEAQRVEVDETVDIMREVARNVITVMQNALLAGEIF